MTYRLPAYGNIPYSDTRYYARAGPGYMRKLGPYPPGVYHDRRTNRVKVHRAYFLRARQSWYRQNYWRNRTRYFSG